MNSGNDPCADSNYGLGLSGERAHQFDITHLGNHDYDNCRYDNCYCVGHSVYCHTDRWSCSRIDDYYSNDFGHGDDGVFRTGGCRSDRCSDCDNVCSGAYDSACESDDRHTNLCLCLANRDIYCLLPKR
jgi:hypothetical protein